MKNNPIYFIGIGGIGMSALARYYHDKGYNVAGYDRTPSRLTNELQAEGIDIIFEDNTDLLPKNFRNPEVTRVVYTPAIPEDNNILQFFRSNKFELEKRAYTLGQLLIDNFDAICVAGTHGKTTTSTLTAHILTHSEVGCSAILGGISANYNTNYWLANNDSHWCVTEADEYDRSFLELQPQLALISAMDADHLDIYGTKEEMQEAFLQFAQKIVAGGALVYNLKTNFPIDRIDEEVEVFSYSLDDSHSDFYATNIKLDGRCSHFSVITPMGRFDDLTLSIPGLHNVENAVGAIALAVLAGAESFEVRQALATFKGNRRRFEYHIDTPNLVLIDDYAHHPEEIRAMIRSLRAIYPKRDLTVVFQPHLYTRTRDLKDGFCEVLSLADHLILLPIYPARELPIPGVTSEILMENIVKMKSPVGISSSSTDCTISSRENLPADILARDRQIVLMVGAGDIETMVPNVEQVLKTAYRL